MVSTEDLNVENACSCQIFRAREMHSIFDLCVNFFPVLVIGASCVGYPVRIGSSDTLFIERHRGVCGLSFDLKIYVPVIKLTMKSGWLPGEVLEP